MTFRLLFGSRNTTLQTHLRNVRKWHSTAFIAAQEIEGSQRRLLDAIPSVSTACAFYKFNHNSKIGRHLLQDDGAARRTVNHILKTEQNEVDDAKTTLIVECNAGPGLLTRHLLNKILAIDQKRDDDKLKNVEKKENYILYSLDNDPTCIPMITQIQDVFKDTRLNYLENISSNQKTISTIHSHMNEDSLNNMNNLKIVGNLHFNDINGTIVTLLDDFFWSKNIFAKLHKNSSNKNIFESVKLHFYLPSSMIPFHQIMDVSHPLISNESQESDSSISMYRTKASLLLDEVELSTLSLSSCILLCLSDITINFKLKNGHFIPYTNEEAYLTTIQPILKYPHFSRPLSIVEDEDNKLSLLRDSNKSIELTPENYLDIIPTPKCIVSVLSLLHLNNRRKLSKVLYILIQNDVNSLENLNNTIEYYADNFNKKDIVQDDAELKKDKINNLYESIMNVLANTYPSQIDVSDLKGNDLLYMKEQLLKYKDANSENIGNKELISNNLLEDNLIDIDVPEEFYKRTVWERVRFPKLTRSDIYLLTKILIANQLMDIETGKFRYQLIKNEESLIKNASFNENEHHLLKNYLLESEKDDDQINEVNDYDIEELESKKKEIIQDKEIPWFKKRLFLKKITIQQDLLNIKKDVESVKNNKLF